MQFSRRVLLTVIDADRMLSSADLTDDTGNTLVSLRTSVVTSRSVNGTVANQARGAVIGHESGVGFSFNRWKAGLESVCQVLKCKKLFSLSLEGHAIFKLTYLSNHDYKALYFECDAATVNEIVLKVSLHSDISHNISPPSYPFIHLSISPSLHPSISLSPSIHPSVFICLSD